MARVLNAPQESPSSAELAKSILNTPGISLWNTLPSGNPPKGSDSLTNMQDTAEGRPAHRSDYGTAPGGTVPLGADMLEGMLRLHDEHGYSFDVSTIAGGSHSKRSRHYAGVAFDISTVNGVQVAKDDGVHDRVMAALREMGATEVLGPGNAGHDHHIHAAWPRPEALDTGEPDTDILGDEEYRNTTK
jgi:hypothetical protein